LPGVQVAAPQRYVDLAAVTRFHDSNDLTAFDPGLDFTLLPWLRENLDHPFRRGDVIGGGRRGEAVGSEVRLFGGTFTVYGERGYRATCRDDEPTTLLGCWSLVGWLTISPFST
jgi:hypothetical protein